jgi:hypothetical protein
MLRNSVLTAKVTELKNQYFLFTLTAKYQISYLVLVQGVRVFDVSEPGGMQRGSVQQSNPLQHTKTCSHHAD